MNPTNDVLEQRVSAMEGGVAALALSAGQAAITYSILNPAEADNNIVSVPQAFMVAPRPFSGTCCQNRA